MFRFATIAAAAAFLATPAFAADCSVQVEANDAMQFNTKSIDVPKSCKSFTVQLKHVGKLPKASMGHNWVLAKTADMEGVNKDGIAAGVASNYLKAGDTRVIAATKLLGGGESDSVKVDVSKLKAGETYSFFCSFPGHAGLMKGTLQVK
ncbi:azurin [Alicycliphilus denitrificans]|jgi:azurin|uniref:Azurin n=1 Tax=Alicycliphilus denitrificans TaxID=179636 RepID=A0A420KHN1_9BURK|nr:azurin [Alicycliphilus denitrificans]RKJ99453.1 azurin [Alicycliphilus denitrificans]